MIALAIFGLPACGDDDGSDLDAAVGDAAAIDAPTSDAAMSADAAAIDAASGPPRTPRVYVGLTSGDLVVYSLDAASGELDELSRTRTGNFPSFLAPSPDGRFLYVVHEGARELAALAVTPGTGATAVIDRANTEGDGPTHVGTTPDGRYVAVANYGGGSVALFPIERDGTIGGVLDVERPGGQAHQIVFDAASAHAYVASKEDDLVAQYAVGASGLEPLTPASIATRDRSGPRHLALSIDERFAYVIHELDLHVTVHPRDASGVLGAEVQRIPTLPDGMMRGSTAEIAVHPSGRFVYGSNRGHDSIVVFRVEADGRLALVEHEPTRGRTPRSFALAPDGATLIVANQDSRDVQVFAIDPGTGALTHQRGITTDGDAFYVGVFAIPAE